MGSFFCQICLKEHPKIFPAFVKSPESLYAATIMTVLGGDQQVLKCLSLVNMGDTKQVCLPDSHVQALPINSGASEGRTHTVRDKDLIGTTSRILHSSHCSGL